MSVTVTPVSHEVFKILGDFLTLILPAGVEVTQAQTNRVAPPAGSSYVTMNLTAESRLSTNVVTQSSDPLIQQASIVQSVDTIISIQVFGDDGGDNSNIITTLFRDEFACEFFAANSVGITPLYMDNPKQIPFKNGEQQIENRWVIETHIQVDPTIFITQQSATQAVVTAINIDTIPSA